MNTRLVAVSISYAIVKVIPGCNNGRHCVCAWFKFPQFSCVDFVAPFVLGKNFILVTWYSINKAIHLNIEQFSLRYFKEDDGRST